MQFQTKSTPEALYRELRQSNVRLLHADGSEIELPASVEEFFEALIGSLREQRFVTLLERDTLISTEYAAHLLDVTPQQLNSAVEQNEIPLQLEQLVRLRDVLAYRSKLQTKRRQILDELTRAEALDGLYDLDAINDRELARSASQFAHAVSQLA